MELLLAELQTEPASSPAAAWPIFFAVSSTILEPSLEQREHCQAFLQQPADGVDGAPKRVQKTKP